MAQFEDAIHNACLDDLKYTGVHFTWSNKQLGASIVNKKLDRVLVNNYWLNFIDSAFAEFFPSGISYHSRAIVTIGAPNRKKSSFKFLNCWTSYEDFLPLVSEIWRIQIKGTLQFQLASKLKLLKQALKGFHKHKITGIES